MRHAVAFTLLACAALPVCASLRSNLTVVLKIDQKEPPAALREMRLELNRLLNPAGLHLDVRLESDIVAGESFDELIVVTIKGHCTIEQDPMLIDERGPLAYAHTSGSDILPFAVVSCDNVRHAVDAALWGGQHAERDRLFGRALARVVAHELYHVLQKTAAHSHNGIFRPELSGLQLIADDLSFSPSDLMRLRQNLASR